MLPLLGKNMNKILAACAGFAICCAAEAGWAAGPDSQLVGRWRGTLENYIGAEDHGREFVVSADGTCRWGLTGKAGKAECDYGPTITIRTGSVPPSTVRLSLNDGNLLGGLVTPQGRKMYPITMTKIGAK